MPKNSKFWLVGSTRGPDDELIVTELKDLAKQLKIEDSIDFKLNVSRDEINQIFRQAKVGIHTMKQEHFGISIVEMMSAGLVTIAHASAGPLQDIIGGSEDTIVGYLANTEAQYAKWVVRAMNDYNDQLHKNLVKDAKQWVTDAFGIATFETQFANMV